MRFSQAGFPGGFFSFIVTTAALMASSVLRFLPMEQALYQPGNRQFHKRIPQTHRGTDKYFGGVSVNVSRHHSLHDSRISHMTSPVGNRPLSCGPGQCWCWFLRIHRDRFHPPETEMKKILPLLHWDTNRTQLFDNSDYRHNISSAENTMMKKKKSWCDSSPPRERLDQADVVQRHLEEEPRGRIYNERTDSNEGGKTCSNPYKTTVQVILFSAVQFFRLTVT